MLRNPRQQTRGPYPKEMKFIENRKNISGTVTNPPLYREIAKGRAVAGFNLRDALSNTHRCIARGTMAKWVKRSISEGSEVCVLGREVHRSKVVGVDGREIPPYKEIVIYEIKNKQPCEQSSETGRSSWKKRTPGS